MHEVYDDIMKSSITYLIIKKIGETGHVTLNAFFQAKYSRTHLSRHLFGLDSSPITTSRTVISLLSRLKKQGLVERRGTVKHSLWILTNKGKRWLKENHLETMPTVPAVDGVTRLVIFDIPEYERNKRNIIRAELVGHNFQILQRSVWIGYNPLSEDFIKTLDTLNLKNKVHIFSVEKMGTLYR